MAGVQAGAEALAAAAELDQRRELLERAPERPAGAGRVLEQQRARLGLRERFLDHRAGALERLLDGAAVLERRARVQDDAARLQLRAGVERDDQRRQRLVTNLGILGRAVEKVDGVDDHRLDVRALHRLVVGGDLLVAVDARLPGPRVLVEDLDRTAAPLFPALDSVRRTTGGGDVGANQHRMIVNHAGALSSIADRRVAHRQREDGTVQLASGPRLGRRARSADRGHRSRALDARERPADLRQPRVARDRLGRGRRSTSPTTRPATPRSSSSCSIPDTPTARRPGPSRSRRSRTPTAATAASAVRTRAQGAVRLRMPDEGATIVRDIIRGESAFENALQDDLVIARADGTPIYHLAVVVDDHDAGITHVVRGADHYSNTPKHVRIYEALGAEPPIYAHLPLLHGPDGKKLSKRHGAASVQDLRNSGYLREAVINYLALLGWGYDETTTFFTIPELQELFSLERVSKNPADLRRAEAAPDQRPLRARAARSTT